MKRASLVLRVLLLAMGISAAGGCAGPAFRLGRVGAQGAIQGAEDSEEALRRVLRQSLLRDDLLDRVAERFVQGALSGMDGPEVRARAALLSKALLEELRGQGDAALEHTLKQAGKQLEETLDAVSVRALGRADAALKELLHKDLVEATQVLLRKNAETLARALAAELQGTLGESLRQTSGQLARVIVAEAASSLRAPETRVAARDFLRDATREAVLGAGDGLRQGLQGSPLQTALAAGLVGLGLLLLLCAGALWFFIRQYLLSARALAVIAQKINESGAEAGALKQAIRQGAARSKVDDWLSDFLKRRGL
jgi:hypothetical protein